MLSFSSIKFIEFRKFVFANNNYMLDKRSEVLLRIINKECNEGSYKVIDVDDILRLMPNRFKVDLETINQLMNYLKSGDYISIKYSDNEVFCVSPLPRGRRMFELEKEERHLSKKRYLVLFNVYFLLIFNFWCLFRCCLFSKNHLIIFIKEK